MNKPTLTWAEYAIVREGLAVLRTPEEKRYKGWEQVVAAAEYLAAEREA